MMYKIHDNKSIRFKLRQLGLALIITGAALGMYLNFFLGDYGWNSYIMFASIVLLPNYNNLLNFRLPSYCIDLGGILYFQILCIFTFTHRYCQMSYQNTIIYISSIYYWLHNIINVIKDIRFEFFVDCRVFLDINISLYNIMFYMLCQWHIFNRICKSS